MPRTPSPNAGYWIYNTLVLRVYDWLVPGLLNRFVWRCPTAHIRAVFREHLSPRHADIGIGTGFFLANAYRDRASNQRRNSNLVSTECYAERLWLLDANPATVTYCKKRLGKLGLFADGQIQGETIDATKPEQLDATADSISQDGLVDSVSANYLFHCLPNGLDSSEPTIAFANSILGEEGVFFGSMILAEQTEKRLITKTIAGLFRRLNIFGQRKDSLQELRERLNKHFKICDIRIHGCVAVFVARAGIAKQ